MRRYSYRTVFSVLWGVDNTVIQDETELSVSQLNVHFYPCLGIMQFCFR